MQSAGQITASCAPAAALAVAVLTLAGPAAAQAPDWRATLAVCADRPDSFDALAARQTELGWQGLAAAEFGPEEMLLANFAGLGSRVTMRETDPGVWTDALALGQRAAEGMRRLRPVDSYQIKRGFFRAPGALLRMELTAHPYPEALDCMLTMSGAAAQATGVTIPDRAPAATGRLGDAFHYSFRPSVLAAMTGLGVAPPEGDLVTSIRLYTGFTTGGAE